MTVPDLAIGQSVWVSDREHPKVKGWKDCYGHISGFDEPDPEEANVAYVWFSDSETQMEVPTMEFYSWNEKYNSWSLYLSNPEDYECNTSRPDPS